MKKLIFLVLFLLACAQDDKQDFLHKVYDWQTREADCPKIETTCYIGGTNFRSDLRSVLVQIPQPIPTVEEGDYWQTSCETTNRRTGDCEDIANHQIRIIADSCIGTVWDIDVRNRTVERPEDFHTYTVVYIGNDVYEIDQYKIRFGESPYPVAIEYDMGSVF